MSREPHVYAFGPYRLDPVRRSLLRGGEAVRLTARVFDTLLYLVEHHERLVSRAELQEAVWQGRAVDENNLGQAISALRKALPSDAASHYVVTVAGRGYRFSAPVRVEMVPPEAAAGIAEPVTPDQPGRPAVRRRLWIALPVAVAAGGAAIAAAYVIGHNPPMTDKDTIVLADFSNTTGEPVFDETLRQGVSVALHQSPFLALIGDQRIRQTLRLMGQPADARVTPKLAREICERTGSTATVSGSVARLGTTYVLGLRAENCRTGDVLDEDQVDAAGKDGVLAALDEMTRRFRSRMGEARASLATYDVPLASATTPSLDALKAYSMGLKLEDTKGADSAIPFFEHAIELDPQFASAYAALALVHSSNGEKPLADGLGARAYQLRDRTSDDERYFITAFYDLRVTTEIEKGLQVLQAWEQTYPRQALPHDMLGGIAYPATGDYEKAIGEAALAVQIEPDSAVGYQLLAGDYIFADRLADATRVLDAAARHDFGSPVFAMLRYDIAFLSGNESDMQRASAMARQDSPLMPYREAFVAAYGGRLRAATDLMHRADALARAAGSDDKAALFDTPTAIWEALFGRTEAARADAMRALADARDPDVSYAAGFALALAGDAAGADDIAKSLASRGPRDTSVRFTYLPSLLALICLDRGDPKGAIEALQAAIPYDVAAPRIQQHAFFGALYPVYVRGRAYLAAGQGAQAAAEFHKILAHRGLVASDPIGALAQLELGRAEMLRADKNAARNAYRAFLALWEDADPDLPILLQARSEYAKLD
jgi:DNA-binding winged helix-turn-helix (wHTH) protein